MDYNMNLINSNVNIKFKKILTAPFVPGRFRLKIVFTSLMVILAQLSLNANYYPHFLPAMTTTTPSKNYHTIFNLLKPGHCQNIQTDTNVLTN